MGHLRVAGGRPIHHLDRRLIDLVQGRLCAVEISKVTEIVVIVLK